MLSIIIPNWNNSGVLRKCLESVTKNTECEHEVIVVDNGSSDGSAQMVKASFPKVRLIRNKENLGFSKAVNQGLREAKGEKLLLLNNDVKVPAGWCKAFLKASEGPGVGIVGCKLVFPNGDLQHAGCSIKPWGIVRHGYREKDNGQYDEEREVDYVSGAAFLINRGVIAEIGLLDEEYSPAYYEETDYCWRARKAGFKVLYSPEPVVEHVEWATTEKMPDLYYIRERNRVRFMLKNYPLTWLLISVPFELARFLASFPLIRTGRFLRAYYYNLSRLNEVRGSK